MSERKVRVAIAQAEPVFLDLGGSVKKAVRLMADGLLDGTPDFWHGL